jgi:hypothetical protein
MFIYMSITHQLHFQESRCECVQESNILTKSCKETICYYRNIAHLKTLECYAPFPWVLSLAYVYELYLGQ